MGGGAEQPVNDKKLNTKNSENFTTWRYLQFTSKNIQNILIIKMVLRKHHSHREYYRFSFLHYISLVDLCLSTHRIYKHACIVVWLTKIVRLILVKDCYIFLFPSSGYHTIWQSPPFSFLVWLDGAPKDFTAEVNSRTDNQENVWTISSHSGYACAFEWPWGIFGVLWSGVEGEFSVDSVSYLTFIG